MRIGRNDIADNVINKLAREYYEDNDVAYEHLRENLLEAIAEMDFEEWSSGYLRCKMEHWMDQAADDYFGER